jgi:hypothetical protein
VTGRIRLFPIPVRLEDPWRTTQAFGVVIDRHLIGIVSRDGGIPGIWESWYWEPAFGDGPSGRACTRAEAIRALLRARKEATS